MKPPYGERLAWFKCVDRYVKFITTSIAFSRRKQDLRFRHAKTWWRSKIDCLQEKLQSKCFFFWKLC